VASEHTGVSGLAGRYATALFELAEDEKRLDEVAEDLATLRRLIDESEDLRRLIRSPVVARADQGRAMDAVMARAGIGTLSRNFVGLVARNRRLFALPDMVRGYRAMLAARRGEVTAEVTSAVALSDAQRAALGAALNKVVAGKITIEARLDPALIGGLIVRIGSRMVDSSLRTKLQRLQLVLKGAG
jgi:F-type H+-transporting ATPase subunit delta